MSTSSGTVVTVVRDLVSVAGPDARSYLHGQISQDVMSLLPGRSRWTLVLTPNGRVEVLARALCVADDRFDLDTEPGYGEALAERLNRFRIRVKAELQSSTVDLHVPLDTTGEPSVQETAPTAHQSSRVGWWDRGLWLTAPPDGFGPGTLADYDRARIAAGWPAMGSEIIPGERIPGEVAVVPVAVSFTKGCYPGQELVERMDSRQAQAPRQLRVVRLDAVTASGDDVEVMSTAGDIALAYVRRGVDVGAVPGPTSS